MSLIQIEVGDKAFEFSTYSNWVNKARGWFEQRGLTGNDVVCLDAKNRICRSGRDFMRARDDGSFPIVVYRLNPI